MGRLAQTLGLGIDMTAYLKQQLQDSLAVVDTCLECIYSGKTHMYRALAGQLRLLLCDTQRNKDNSLLAAVYPKLEVSAFSEITWSKNEAGSVRLLETAAGTNRIAQMPLEISVFPNGLAVADLELNNSNLLPIAEWSGQRLTFHPTRLSAKAVIRAVADKGGGAHVDADSSLDLRFMYQYTPAGRTYAELFVIAIGRFMQALGEKLLKYKGCRVPDEFAYGAHQKLNLLVAAHHECAEA